MIFTLADMKKILQCVSAKTFFPKYTRIKSYTHKMRGKNGVGKPVDFTHQDIVQIKKGVVKMTNDILKKLS